MAWTLLSVGVYLSSLVWTIHVQRIPELPDLAPLLVVLLGLGQGVYLAIKFTTTDVPQAISNLREAEYLAALERIKTEPDKAKPVWDVARTKLEFYIDSNLSQNHYIFWVSLIVMMVGFGLAG